MQKIWLRMFFIESLTSLNFLMLNILLYFHTEIMKFHMQNTKSSHLRKDEYEEEQPSG